MASARSGSAHQPHVKIWGVLRLARLLGSLIWREKIHPSTSLPSLLTAQSCVGERHSLRNSFCFIPFGNTALNPSGMHAVASTTNVSRTVSVLVHFCFTNFASCYIWPKLCLLGVAKILSSPTLPSFAKLVSQALARKNMSRSPKQEMLLGFGAARYLECCASPSRFTPCELTGRFTLVTSRFCTSFCFRHAHINRC